MILSILICSRIVHVEVLHPNSATRRSPDPCALCTPSYLCYLHRDSPQWADAVQLHVHCIGIARSTATIFIRRPGIKSGTPTFS